MHKISISLKQIVKDAFINFKSEKKKSEVIFVNYGTDFQTEQN